jgi:hypothetical protein
LRGRVGIGETAELEGAANARPEPLERRNFVAVEERPRADDAGTLKPDTLEPIMLNPITIAQIQIRALN